MTAVAEHVARPLEELVDSAVSGTAPGAVPGALAPSWQARARGEAAAWIGIHGFPTRKDEDWRYLTLRSVLAEPFELGTAEQEPADGGAWAEGALQACSLGLGGMRLVFVNGRFTPGLSRLTSPPAGAWVSSAGPTFAAGGEPARPPSWGDRREPRHGFTALNTALACDGAVVTISDGAVIDEVIELVYLTEPGGHPLLTSPRSLFSFGKDSRATIVETYAGPHGERYCTNAVTEVTVEEGAVVEHYRLQDESDRAFHFSSLEVHQAAGSHFGSHLVALGAEIARHEVRVLLDGAGADLDLDALYLPRGTQHHDHPVLVEHAAAGCTSRQRYVGIVDDHAHGVFNGHVVVRPGAAGTDASQSNKNLLLSELAEVDTRPRLEIFTDDVACAHGAAVGRLDADALFYLRSRGMPEALARGVLVQGFASQALDRLALAPLRSRAEALIAGRLALDDGPSSVLTKGDRTTAGED